MSKSYDGRAVLTDVSLSVKPGERLGIVGENGSGKSTLLRLLAGVERPDDGEALVSDDLGHLGQTLDLPPDHTVRQAVDVALSELRAMELRMRELESALTEEVMDEYSELLTAYELKGGYEADARVEKSFHGLGLAHVAPDRRLSSLSGGELARLGLACVLAARPRVLLLDEPTNHLDGSALSWLEERLREHRGSVVVVSHDRVFLDRVATAVVEVEHGTVTRFGGGYPGFLEAKAAARARWEQAYAAWCDEVRQVREHASTTAHRVAAGRAMRDNNKMAYDRAGGRVQRSVAGRVRNAHERLRRLEESPVPRPPDPLRFQGTFHAHPAPRGATTPPPPGDDTATNHQQQEEEHPATGRDRLLKGSASDHAPQKRAQATEHAQVTDHALPEHAQATEHALPEHAQVTERPQPRPTTPTGHPRPQHATLTGHSRPQHATLAQRLLPGSGVAAGRCAVAGDSEVLVELRDVHIGDRLHVPALTISAGDRLLVRGANGAGKSTLLRAVAAHARHLKVGYLAQEVAFDPDLSVLDAYGGLGDPDERRAALLSTGLFRPSALTQKVGTLSVGQRRRLALARLLPREHDLLLLDEPTNHLSPVLAEELQQALDTYRGALVVVSHDRAFVSRFRGTVINVAGGRIS
ncbi:ABC transporter [Nonomuraea maritima]|uniref:ABC transporter n=1 Tax=Nonomuraea maritima TaxID=683260 RepID=A0A1G9PHT1_9ACTN|nr:ABC-F family ATP-binding cassette domain-containing protein [Nonomuraea maritima]SDL98284.1 ABC transporter [Nonomuraea maritima]